jgi:hypothetical protein
VSISIRESVLESCFAMPMFHKLYQAFWCDLGFRFTRNCGTQVKVFKSNKRHEEYSTVEPMFIAKSMLKNGVS